MRIIPFVISIAAIAAQGHPFPSGPHDLKIALAQIDSSGIRCIRLRTFSDSMNKPWMLAREPIRLETSIHRLDGWSLSGPPVVAGTPWGKLRQEEIDSGLGTAGLTHILGHDRGVVLSVDLCPSRKPMDRRIVKDVWESFRRDDKPVPISFSISGAWMRQHGDDLNWLLRQVDSGRIDPTWINHTDNHRYIKGLPDKQNFLFLPGTNVADEILGAELEMLRHGIVPSVFFRFPGLMDDPTVFAQVISAGLLPVGSDAWLAKRQSPKRGSIVLIHGNGNEPIGVDDFIRLLRSEREAIHKGWWRLEDLSDELEEEER
jgi:hypothetical protein